MILKNNQRFNPYSSFEDNGINYPSGWYFLATQEEKDLLGFTEVLDPEYFNPGYIDFRFFYLNGDSIQQKPLEQCKEVLKIELADIRWSTEVAGIIYNNITYITDIQSRTSYLGAMQRSLLDPNFTVNWKARTETDPSSAVFVTLSASEMVTIANACINYISLCFEYENNLLQQIEISTTLNELTGIDLGTGWPSRYYS